MTTPMDKKNKLISKVSWIIQSDPYEANMYENKNYNVELPVSPEILNIKLRGKKIAILMDSGKVVLTTPFIGNTFGEWMQCLYNGVSKKLIVAELSREEITGIYNRISGWFDSDTRLKMVKKFESNKLKVSDLLGNHYFFEGRLKLEKTVWTYGLGS
jgi:hypothetical protein